MTNKLNSIELTKSEEDYLKAIFQLMLDSDNEKVGNNKLADYLNISPASVNNMVKKLKLKKLLKSERYAKLQLTDSGRDIAVGLIRKHRLWETFLSKYLNFTWDEVHDVAEQLEHVKSPKLINELDRFMDFPKKDPHGEVIPDAEGNYRTFEKVTLASLDSGTICKLISVNDGSVEFLRYVSEIGLALSSEIKVIEKRSFDNSVKIEFNDSIETVSQKFADNVFVEILSN
ncbi:metal-dependent transcriptional regulator [Croceibacter atlanticus]|jgi:DtxR family Mn-dependent transcriptional regulator|uniref:Transcriptional regulator MntR n=1 Tax=Croceibacter atlanticus (strain ATCC BAA-628 / JCM 21780 / CIP 108009 / IAM 15332 / KCTC 12090 / HTCC2559) TaxID=216432 RepID=A3U5H7_CROAH|nr:metal-dependent transcriptional regulator [Croceibacter atlanticus]EAP87494.1 putative transcriptional regulator [Croceibacter atlanticus HTCC2559]MBW4970272.1 metal-dependent transcriptional regulator [Croceibacter atlanticus]HAT71034.1 metal-dependent transcriptional regulator [Flavobacteriaceae bacterium]